MVNALDVPAQTHAGGSSIRDVLRDDYSRCGRVDLDRLRWVVLVSTPRTFSCCSAASQRGTGIVLRVLRDLQLAGRTVPPLSCSSLRLDPRTWVNRSSLTALR